MKCAQHCLVVGWAWAAKPTRQPASRPDLHPSQSVARRRVCPSVPTKFVPITTARTHAIRTWDFPHRDLSEQTGREEEDPGRSHEVSSPCGSDTNENECGRDLCVMVYMNAPVQVQVCTLALSLSSLFPARRALVRARAGVCDEAPQHVGPCHRGSGVPAGRTSGSAKLPDCQPAGWLVTSSLAQSQASRSDFLPPVGWLH